MPLLRKIQVSPIVAGETILMTEAGMRDVSVAFGFPKNPASAFCRQRKDNSVRGSQQCSKLLQKEGPGPFTSCGLIEFTLPFLGNTQIS